MRAYQSINLEDLDRIPATEVSEGRLKVDCHLHLGAVEQHRPGGSRRARCMR
jgi:hypothetical protein